MAISRIVAHPAAMRASTFVVEFWALLALLIPLTAAGFVLGLHLTDWHGSEQLVNDIAEHNNAVVILVQIVSVILGFILLQALCTIVKIFLRSSISEKPISLERARFLNALSQAKILIAERHIFTAVTILLVLFSYIPGAIWAGAISPRIVLRTVDRNVQVPYYADNYAPSGRVNEDYNIVIQNDKGIFTIDPNRFTGSLLNSARQASNPHVPRPKLDDTGYSFFGRSFGAGSSVGLDSIPAPAESLSYTFNQTSIVADAHCQRNTSSTFGIAPYSGQAMADNQAWALLVYTAGEYPNGTAVNSMWLYSSSNDTYFAIDYNHQLQSRNAHVFIATTAPPASGLSEASYNQTYCNITFSAHTIHVNGKASADDGSAEMLSSTFLTRLIVNMTARTITTTKLNEVAWPVYAYNATAQALVALRALTVKDNAVGESEVWRAMQSNTETLYYNTYGDFPKENVDDALPFQSIADFISDVLDNNILMAGACQKVFYQSTQLAHGDVSILSVVFGHAEYQYIIFAMTSLVVLFCTCYVVVTQGGTGHRVDLADFANVALNASKGGTSLFENYEERKHYENVNVRLKDPDKSWPGIIYASEKIYANPTTFKLKAMGPDAGFVSASLLDDGTDRQPRG